MGGAIVSRVLLLFGFGLLAVNYAFAQDSPAPTAMQCHLIKLAVAQYGYAAARQHALEAYGPEAVKTGDKCFAKAQEASGASYEATELKLERGARMKYQR